jgi:dihydrofolate reductase
MGEVVYYAAASLDGYIADRDDNLDWLTGYEARPLGPDVAPVEGGYDEFYDEIGALVMGSVTYEWVLDHLGKLEQLSEWPYAGKPTWVLSSRELAAAADDVRIVKAAVLDLYDEMVAAAGNRMLWVVGGAPVASQFADAGLLDHVWVTVVPVVLGAGKPLLERPLPGGPMQLTAALPRESGMVELRYAVAK